MHPRWSRSTKQVLELDEESGRLPADRALHAANPKGVLAQQVPDTRVFGTISPTSAHLTWLVGLSNACWAQPKDALRALFQTPALAGKSKRLAVGRLVRAGSPLLRDCFAKHDPQQFGDSASKAREIPPTQYQPCASSVLVSRVHAACACCSVAKARIP